MHHLKSIDVGSACADPSSEQGIDDGTQNLPKYFAKHGFVDTDPKKVKKNGGGKGNW